MKIKSYTVMQRAVLSLLEEAGGEDIAALVNTVFPNLSSSAKLQNIGSDLLALFESGLIQLRSTDTPLGHSEVLQQQAKEILANFDQYFRWSDDGKIWRWHPAQRLDVVLTNFGVAEAEATLRAYGWQSPKLGSDS